MPSLFQLPLWGTCFDSICVIFAGPNINASSNIDTRANTDLSTGTDTNANVDKWIV